ncbi:MAG: GNAT family N-acetyltransferase [Hellea sp.]|nr:GNAT family N-acetyltransferase [Hellea sp.]
MTIRMETDRLILRDIDIEKDLEAWTEMMSDEETVRFIGGKTMNKAESWRVMASMIGHQLIHGYSFYSVIEKATGKFVGRIGHWFPEGWPEPEIGWTVHPAHTRKGFAKEAGAACIDYAFTQLGWKRTIHVIAEDNIASIKTAEAIGSERLYHISHLPPFGDVNCWAYGQEKP